jgi:integrase
MVWSPVFQRVVGAGGECSWRVGHVLVDEFLEFAEGRARPNTVRAYAHDLKVFFEVVGKEPAEVTSADVLAFITAQRRPRAGAENVVWISDAAAGLSVSTIKRRLAAVSSFYGYLVTRGDVGVEVNPVPRGLPTRRSRQRGQRGVPLVRGVRRLPRILEPGEVEALLAALRTRRDRAMVEAMVLGGLRRCEVLGLRLEDLRLGEWRVFIQHPSPMAWASRVALNLAGSWWRRRDAERRANRKASDQPGRPEHDHADVLAVRQAVHALPRRQRAVLVLRFYQGLSVRETATAMSCAEGTVKSLTSHAIVALRRDFDDLDEPTTPGHPGSPSTMEAFHA